ncbi:MAG TPA: phasin family protein [Allosphingosinicella sp.]|jgi:phasin family protein|nr:phasin family protein [Allosphingosinicella sp.]
MADTKTETHAPKHDAHAKVDAPAHAAPKAAEKAADAAPKAAEKAAPAPVKDAAKATATAASAPAKAAARTAKATTPKRSAAKADKKPARRAPAKTNTAPKRTAAPVAAAAQKAANSTTKTISINLNEGTRNMKNEAKQAADRFQAVFGDVNERAKTAIERNSRVAEELTELTKGNVEAIVASTKVAAKGVETLGQEIAEFSRKSFEDASAAMKGIADVKSPTDFFRLQSDFARGQFDLMVAETSKLSETMIKLAGQAAEPITGRYSVAAERVRTVVAA